MFENICDLKCGSPWELHAMCFLIKLGNWGEVSWYLQKADLSKKKKNPNRQDSLCLFRIKYIQLNSVLGKKNTELHTFFFSPLFYLLFPSRLLDSFDLSTNLKCFSGYLYAISEY